MANVPQPKMKMKAGGKIVILIVLALGMFFGYKKFGGSLDSFIPKGEQAEDVKGMMASGGSTSKNTCIEVGVVTWGGYAGGQYYNAGFQDNDKSRFRSEQGICVNFHVMDDFAASRAAFRAGKIDLLWVTIDAFPTEVGNFGEPVKFLFQADWSRGGDAIVAKAGINSVGDLLGKKIAVAEATPSHTFLLWMLDMAGLSVQDVDIVTVPSAINASEAFKAGQVDAAVVWSPDDGTCVRSVAGSKVLINTKQATHIIADGFMVKQSVFNQKKDQFTKLVKGWMIGAQELNESDVKKKEAAKYLSAAFEGVSENDAYNSINNVRLANYGDNMDFFGLNPSYTNVTGEVLYDKMSKVYSSLRLAERSKIPSYSSVVDKDFISGLNMEGSVAQDEGKKTFTRATAQEAKAVAVASNPVRVSFPSGSAELDQNAKDIIEMKFVENARAFPNARIRIEGNTDKVGSREANVSLSRIRAQAVVNYLVREQGMDPNRFVVVGNGPDRPLCNEDTPVCYAKNRRTDFQILGQ